MPVQDFFDTEVEEQVIDVSASTRKFQTSVVIVQDENKSGILSFLQTFEEQNPQQPQRSQPQTIRPQRQGGR